MIRFASLDARAMEIPFKVAFKHASAERSRMQSLWVEVRTANGTLGVGEGCPRDYVTGETLQTTLSFVAAHRAEWLATIGDATSLAKWVRDHRADIDRNPAAWSAVEIAFLDALGQEGGLVFERVLGTPPIAGHYWYTAVIGDGPEAAFEAQVRRYANGGFRAYKIKLSGDAARDAAKARCLRAAGIAASRVRADANNLFGDARAAIAHLEALDFPFFAIEEPLRAGDREGMREISRALDCPIILDESALREEQLEGLRDDAARWIVNLRISKMGGMYRSIAFTRLARDLGVRIIVGAHVGESSVLTRCGVCIAALAEGSLAGQEGAFGTYLLERDPVEPCWMVDANGLLDVGKYRPIGNGLGVKPVAA